MRLRQFDGLPVRLTEANGDVFEGVCVYNSVAYNEHEYGRAEDGVQIANFLFYRSDIAALESLEGRGFSGPWGRIEEMNVDEGEDTIESELFDEEDIHVLRLLRCLDGRMEVLPCRDGVVRLVRQLASGDGEVSAAARRFLAKWDGEGEARP